MHGTLEPVLTALSLGLVPSTRRRRYDCSSYGCLGKYQPQKKLPVFEHSVEKRFESAYVLCREAAKELRLHCLLGRNQMRIKRPPGCRKLHVRRATVFGAGNAANQSLVLQSVDHPGHRAGVVGDILAKPRRAIGLLVGDRGEYDQLR